MDENQQQNERGLEAAEARGFGQVYFDPKKKNVFFIHGSMTGNNVKANSRLAEEFFHHAMTKSANLGKLLDIPGDFED